MDDQTRTAEQRGAGSRRWFVRGAMGAAGVAVAGWAGARVSFAREQEPGDDHGGHGKHHHHHHRHEHHHHRGNHR
jgi:hypothetical protein